MRPTRHDDVVDLAPRPRLLGHESAEALRGILDHIAAKFRNVEMCRRARLVLGQPLEYMQKRDAAVGLPSQVQREPESLQSGGRKINRTQDTLERDHV
ncbi:hypothetical protein D3C83_12030 [compost metagenome]